MKLERDHTCVRNQNWRCDLPPEQASAVLSALTSSGRYRMRASPPFLITLERDDGTQVLVVPRTGRVQIRVSYEVAPEDRRRVAEGVFSDIARLALA